MEISITEENPKIKDAYLLMEELSEVLQKITGDNGKSSFSIDDLDNRKSFFLIARDKNNKAMGCGSIRQIDENEGEIKRCILKLQRLENKF